MSEKATTQPLDLSCEQCRDLISGYVDRELTRAEREAVERHVVGCQKCAGESSCMTGLKEIVRRWNGIQSGGEFHKNLVEKLVRESRMMSSKPFVEAAERARTASEAREVAPAAQPARTRWELYVFLAALAFAIACLLLRCFVL
jgi:anti-sigma factor RsiW